MGLSHLDNKGEAKMVDISNKKILHREALAEGSIFLKLKTIELIKNNLIKKGDVLAVSRIAAINGAKKTFELIPLCHNIPINTIDISFQIKKDRIDITAKATCEAKTGIEMEALVAVSIAALTIYDMCKSVDRDMKISNIRLRKKVKNEIQC